MDDKEFLQKQSLYTKEAIRLAKLKPAKKQSTNLQRIAKLWVNTYMMIENVRQYRKSRKTNFHSPLAD